jgi:hypothetical protein
MAYTSSSPSTKVLSLRIGLNNSYESVFIYTENLSHPLKGIFQDNRTKLTWRKKFETKRDVSLNARIKKYKYRYYKKIRGL